MALRSLSKGGVGGVWADLGLNSNKLQRTRHVHGYVQHVQKESVFLRRAVSGGVACFGKGCDSPAFAWHARRFPSVYFLQVEPSLQAQWCTTLPLSFLSLGVCLLYVSLCVFCLYLLR